jgi:hypothetical protein
VSSQINITVDSGGLSAKAKQQQQAARLAQLERERTHRIEAEAQAQRDAKLYAEGRRPDGQPLINDSAQKLKPQDEPAASRTGKPLNLGHRWTLRNDYNDNATSGVVIVTFVAANKSGSLFQDPGGTDPSFTRHHGTGSGNQWLSEVVPSVGIAELPADTFSVSGITDPPPSPTSNYSRFHYGTREAAVRVSMQNQYGIVLPSGNGNRITVSGRNAAWYYTVVNAYFAAEGIYSSNGDFLWYINPQTGGTTNEIPKGLIDYSPPSGPSVLSVTSESGTDTYRYAYVSNNSKIRTIAIPNTLQAALDVAYPKPEASQQTFTYRNTGPYTRTRYILAPSTPISGTQGFANNNVAGIATPEIFNSINTVYPFTGGIKAYPVDAYWAMSDDTAGAYLRIKQGAALWPTIYDEGAPFYHGYWPSKNTEPDFTSTTKARRTGKGTLRLASSRQPPGSAPYTASGLSTVWDWNDPAYCREMCLALGFSENDLVP